MDFFNYTRRVSSVVQIGDVPLGGTNPIRIQSMANTSTMETAMSVEQAKRIVDAGGEYVRFTTQGIKEAENLKQIKAGLRKQGYTVPLIADVHFNPKVADAAARYVEKVRINPGNYVDPVRTFRELDYTHEAYNLELLKIKERFIPFLHICKENRTAIRIGVNHGSLSDRILSRYGDTPEGMVESCMEFLRICVEQDFKNVVISIKASNTVVMVRTVRLLATIMKNENMDFPLHLGVTEAGDGEDGRIKSALGIGALLTDGLGDTIRVSLSEEPEAEIPVARKLTDYIGIRQNHPYIAGTIAGSFNYLSPERRHTTAVHTIGGEHLPVVITARLNGEPGIHPQFKPDYMYTGSVLPAVKLEDIQYIVDVNTWKDDPGIWPAFEITQLDKLVESTASMKFLFINHTALTEEGIALLIQHPEVIVLSQSNHLHPMGEHRALVHRLISEGLRNPVIFCQSYNESEVEDLQIKSAADIGAFIMDGFCDGVFFLNRGNIPPETVDAISFGVLQAARLRTSKTEYISCPGCGRTLFNLQETIARVKDATSHLKGLKIGIMGCIVNGPGEMADADYGYVGAGRGKVSLYKGKTCIEKNIPEEEAVVKLLMLIEKAGVSKTQIGQF